MLGSALDCSIKYRFISLTPALSYSLQNRSIFNFHSLFGAGLTRLSSRFHAGVKKKMNLRQHLSRYKHVWLWFHSHWKQTKPPLKDAHGTIHKVYATELSFTHDYRYTFHLNDCLIKLCACAQTVVAIPLLRGS